MSENVTNIEGINIDLEVSTSTQNTADNQLQEQQITDETPTYLKEIKTLKGIDLTDEDITNIESYKSAFNNYNQIAPILDDAEIKQIIEYKKQGGTLSDFIEGTKIDTSKLTEEQLILQGIQRELADAGIVDGIEELAGAKYRVEIANKQSQIANRLNEISEELSFDNDNEDLIAERDSLLVQQFNINKQKKELSDREREYLESKKINLLTPKKEEVKTEDISAKLNEYRERQINELKEIDTKLKLLDGKFEFDIKHDDLLTTSQHILLQEPMDDKGTPMVYLQGLGANDITKALYVYNNLQTIVANAVATKELELDQMYNNKHVPNLKDKHYDFGASGKVEIIG